MSTKLLYWADDQVIDRVYQPVVNRLHVSVQEICRFCLVGAMLSAGYSAFIQVHDGRWVDVAARVVGVALAFSVYVQVSSLTGKVVSPYRVVPLFVGIRYFVFAMGALEFLLLFHDQSMLHINDSIGSVISASFWYFIACVEPPPKVRWARIHALARA